MPDGVGAQGPPLSAIFGVLPVLRDFGRPSVTRLAHTPNGIWTVAGTPRFPFSEFTNRTIPPTAPADRPRNPMPISAPTPRPEAQPDAKSDSGRDSGEDQNGHLPRLIPRCIKVGPATGAPRLDGRARCRRRRRHPPGHLPRPTNSEPRGVASEKEPPAGSWPIR